MLAGGAILGATILGAISGLFYPAVGWVKGIPRPIILSDIGNGQALEISAARAFRRMQAAAKVDGVTLTPNSGYRGFLKQAALFASHEAKSVFGISSPEVAAPGYSNHNDGLACDLADASGLITNWNSSSSKWLTANSKQFGFIRDVSSEAWHAHYVGPAIALISG